MYETQWYVTDPHIYHFSDVSWEFSLPIYNLSFPSSIMSFANQKFNYAKRITCQCFPLCCVSFVSILEMLSPTL
jgi:hypothetical protein